MSNSRARSALTFLFFYILLALPAIAAQPGGGEVVTRALPSRSEAAPGDQVVVAVVFEHADGWHIWPAEHVELPPAIAEVAMRTTITLPDSIDWISSIDGIQWPDAKPTPVANPMGGAPIAAPTYGGRAVAYIPITISPAAEPGPKSLDLSLFYQACNDTVCLPPEEPTLTVTLTISPTAAATPNAPDLFAAFDSSKVTPADPPAPDAAPKPGPSTTTNGAAAATSAPPATPSSPSLFGYQLGNSVVILLLASILGGAILNLTPCVLPVIPIKVMTLVQHAGGSRRRALFLGLWMALGVVFFWVAAGLPMAIFSAALDPSRLIFGTWWITLALGLLIALMGLGIMGLFMINLPQSVYMVNTRADSPSGSFMFGVMTAVLGLPCFGFVAGGLLAGAATLPPLLIMVIFLGLGVGMAAPYLVLSAYPNLVNKVPRTGPASELVKQVMGLLLLAAAAFFVAAGVKALLLEKPWLSESIAWWAVAFFITIAGLWLAFRTLQIARKTWPKVVMPGLSLLAIVAAVLFADGFSATAREDYLARAAAGGADDSIVPGAWLPYTPERMEKALASGKVVIADFTADWCINCKALKRGVLDRDPVRSRVTTGGDVILIEVDLTSKTAPGWRFLADLGRSNVPTLAIFGPGLDNPIIHNAYTPETVLASIAQAAGNPSQTSPPPTPAPSTLGRSN